MDSNLRFVDPPHHRRPVSFHKPRRVFFPWGITFIGRVTMAEILFLPFSIGMSLTVSVFLSAKMLPIVAIVNGGVGAIFSLVALDLIDRYRIYMCGSDGVAILLSTHKGIDLLWRAERLCARRERFECADADDDAHTLGVWNALIDEERYVEMRQWEIISRNDVKERVASS